MAKKLSKADREKLERALCTLVDYEGPITDALAAKTNSAQTLGKVCDALRDLVD